MNISLDDNPIQYTEPDISLLKKSGYNLVDMHLHTCHSDGLPEIAEVLRYAKNHQIGVAITDHNEISGVLKAISQYEDLLIIPGIELETIEGPHLLMYFFSAGDLQDYFTEFEKERNRITPGLPKNISVLQCLTLAESYDCIKIAAHPFGYYGINRGVLKCVEKSMLPGVMDHLDGIEAICGGMMKNLNQKAINYVKQHQVPYTGGSDAHILSDIGSVVTGSYGETTEEFLSCIKKRENIVIGKNSDYLRKGATAGVIAWSFLPYTASRLSLHYQFNKKRTGNMVSYYKEKFTQTRNIMAKKEEESEERRK